MRLSIKTKCGIITFSSRAMEMHKRMSDEENLRSHVIITLALTALLCK